MPCCRMLQSRQLVATSHLVPAFVSVDCLARERPATKRASHTHLLRRATDRRWREGSAKSSGRNRGITFEDAVNTLGRHARWSP